MIPLEAFALMKIAVLAVSVLALSATSSFAGQMTQVGPTIGVLDSQRVVTESAEGKARLAKVQALQRQKATELKAKQDALDAIQQQLAKTTEPAARTQLVQQEQQERDEFQRATVQAQADIQTLQRQNNAEFQAHVRTILVEVLKGKNITIVLNDAAVVWALSPLDLTDEVIQGLNAASRPASAAGAAH
jgi:Skp family chaperone for outer membrane proteins